MGILQRPIHFTCYKVLGCGALACALFGGAVFAQSKEEAFAKRIEEGKTHWAYQPLARPAAPQVDNAEWSANPIDAFVYSRLQAENLSPSEEASKRTLIRRAYYDLLGLSPSPEEVEAFTADAAPDAYEKLLDRLLASPHYGEKWGRHWLDLVRYAETHGYERDAPKPHMWRYRDYVVNAFNQDKPYDQFIREQLAGDELDVVTPESITATGYYRLGIWDDEPADKVLARYDELDGIVDTTSRVFLAMTIACARCHEHKIDPIPQEDYYRFMAFFHNIEPTKRDAEPVRSVMTPEEQAAYEKESGSLKRAIDSLERKMKDVEQEFAALWKEGNAAVVTSDISDLKYRYYRDTWVMLPDFDALKPEDEGALPNNLISLSPQTRPDSFGLVFMGNLHVPADGDYTFRMDSDDGSRLIVNGTVVIDHDGAHALGEVKTATIFLEEKIYPIRVEYFQNTSNKAIKLDWSGPGFQNRFLSEVEGIGGKPVRELVEEHGEKVLDAGTWQRYVALKKELEKRKAMPPVGGKFASAVTELGATVPDSFVQRRGNPHYPGDQVYAQAPLMLAHGLEITPTPRPENKSCGLRRELADWIADPQNPATSRVIANRIWKYHFGRGIVESTSDFGIQGIPPTHPELLDWLATEFVAQGWSFKRMHKLIMLSQTYRQDSKANDAAMAKDPRNTLWWRFDMRRLTAEEVRDSILAANGTLNLELGGPQVYPPLPAEVLATSSQPDLAWGKATPQQAARRSIYIHVKRSLTVPFLTDFDFADTDNTCPERFSTAVPTQALNMINSEFILEAADKFASRLMRETLEVSNPETKQVERAFELLTTRPPTIEEVERGVKFMRELREEFGLSEEKALERFCLMVYNLNEFVYLD